MKIDTNDKCASLRAAIQRGRAMLRNPVHGIAVCALVREIRKLESELSGTGSERTPYCDGPDCLHVWVTQDAPMGQSYCLACGRIMP